MAKEDYLIRLSMLEQEGRKLEEQLQLINQQLQEFQVLNLSLEKLNKTEEKEILAGLGRGIYFKTELKDKKLFVNVGDNIILKKSPEETIEIINKQIRQLEGMKEKLLIEIENINHQLQELVEETQRVS